MYLVAYGGFTPGFAGLIWFVKEMTQITSQVPIGWICDHSANKRMWLIVFSALSSLTPLVVTFTLNVPALIVTKIIEGMASTGLRVFKGPFALGIAGHATFESFASKTEIADHSGSLVAALGAGLMAYFLYPNIGSLFWVLGLFSIIAVFFIVFMRKRKKSTKKNSIVSSSFSENNECDLDSVESSVINNEWARNSSRKPSDLDEKQTSPSLWNIFFYDRNLAFFCTALFMFHFGNAAVMPLLSQVLALENSREGIPYTVANIAIAQFFSIAGVKMMDFFTNRGYRINVPIFIGYSLLIPRILIIFLLLKYWPNPYALVATQMIDGIGAGVNGLAVMKVTKDLTYGSNSFGVAIALTGAFEAFGAAMSNLCSGYVVTAVGYEAGFLFLLLPAVLCPILILTLKVKVPDNLDETDADIKNHLPVIISAAEALDGADEENERLPADYLKIAKLASAASG